VPDARVLKMADVLVSYSLDLKPGQQVVINTTPLAEELTLAVYERAIKAGAHPLVRNAVPGSDEAFYRYASDAQLDYVSPVDRMIMETFDARLTIGASANTRALSGVDPQRIARARRAAAPLQKVFMQRSASGALRWCSSVYPTNAGAQEADMSLTDYQDFVYGACMLDEADPVAAWQREGESQRRLQAWLAGKDQVVMKGANLDLRMSIKGRRFKESDGKRNFPSGEIFTGPVEDSVNGWVRFRYPGIQAGREVTDIELWLENGKVVREKASKEQELLTSLLNSDAGARYVGEWGIGTNYRIQRFSRNMLFDEKIGGTIHLALGSGYPDTGSRNESAIHWDMLCDMGDSEITVDGELFYKNGKVVV
jgi:aminopeptidase